MGMVRFPIGEIAALCVFGAILLVDAIASAQPENDHTKPPPAADGTQQHIHNYGVLDAACVRWTDHCRTCNRNAGQGGEASFNCSNLGIACQPKEVECLERGEDKK